MNKITILGSGAYAIALATVIYQNTNKITLWTNFQEEADELNETRENKLRLPGIRIPEEIQITTDLKSAVKDASIILFAIPASAVDEVCFKLKDLLTSEQILCMASKGIENDTCLFLSEVVEKHFRNPMVVIAGPTFAIDLAKQDPAGLTVASNNHYAMIQMMEILKSDSLKLRPIQDVIGVEFCKSIKNVIAIASGILNGMGYEETTNAFLITEALHDMDQFIKKLGGNPNTILSFAGVGDLILTCTSSKSRNFSFGTLIGKRKKEEEIKKYKEETTIEGLYTLQSLYQLLKIKQLEMPLIEVLYQIIYHQEDPSNLITYLISKK